MPKLTDKQRKHRKFIDEESKKILISMSKTRLVLKSSLPRVVDMPITREFYKSNKSDIDAMPVIDGHPIWYGLKLIIEGGKNG